MATIQTSLQLYDGMSSVLNNITSALNMTVSEFEALDNAADRDFNSASIESIRNHLNSANIELDRMQNEFREVDNAIQSSSGNTDRFTNKIIGAAAAIATVQTAKEVLDLSDTYTNTTARLNMMNDELQSTQELQDKIFASAERSRGAYQATADAVSKLGLMAGDAFNSNDEIIGFMEQINKQFTIAGTDTAGRAAAMLQLTQAMGSGVLRGEEFNSILEQAPNIIQTIAEYMNVPKGQLKDMAADGQITADVVKNAMFAAADETNAKFESMPKTFSQIWTSITNYAMQAFNPVLQRLNDIANSEDFTAFVNNAINILSVLANAILWVFNLAVKAGGFIANSWSMIEPFIWGIVAALGIYITYLGIVKAAEIAGNAVKVLSCLASFAHAAMTKTEASVTALATAEQYKFNTALLACPITWIIAAIILLIAIVYAVVAAINHFKNTSISATGIIFGAFAWLGTAIWNIIIGVINGIIQYLWTRFVEPFIGIIEWILNVANGGFDSFGGAVANLVGNIISWFLSLGKVVTKIIDAIFGTNWTEGLTGLQDNVLSWGKNENAITLSREAPTLGHRISYADAWNNGYSLGEKLQNKISGVFSGADMNDFGMNSLDSITQNTANTDENTANIADKMSGLSADVVAIRSWAEKEAINQFTTAEIKVTMQNENRISSDMDIDGVINKFAEGISESMQMAAEGVYD